MIDFTAYGNMLFDRIVVEDFRPFSYTIDGERILVVPQKNQYADFPIDRTCFALRIEEYLRSAVMNGTKHIAKPWNSEKYAIVVNYVPKTFARFREFYNILLDFAVLQSIQLRATDHLDQVRYNYPDYARNFIRHPGLPKFWAVASPLLQVSPAFPEFAARFKGTYSLPFLERGYTLVKMSTELHSEKIAARLRQSERDHYRLIHDKSVNPETGMDYYKSITFNRCLSDFPTGILFNYVVRRLILVYEFVDDEQFIKELEEIRHLAFDTNLDFVMAHIRAYLHLRSRMLNKTKLIPLRKSLKEYNGKDGAKGSVFNMKDVQRQLFNPDELKTGVDVVEESAKPEEKNENAEKTEEPAE